MLVMITIHPIQIIQSLMGNICCQTELEQNPFDSIIPHLNDYEEVQWTEADPNMAKCKQMFISNCTNEEGKEPEVPKLLKHKKDNRYYIGQWDQEGQPAGKGLMYEPQKLIFYGIYKNGYPEGEGKLQFLQKKCEYEGNLRDGRIHGKGKFMNLDSKYTIEGQWVDSRISSGIIRLVSDPNMLNVTFQNVQDKTATINYRDLRVYEGKINWEKILPDGFGTVRFPPNSKKDKYQGQWFQGKFHGKGVMKWKDGTEYDGNYVNGVKQGEGKFIFRSKGYYQGYWKNGKQDGMGIIYDKNGKEEKKGMWVDGKFIKTSEQLAKGQSKQKEDENQQKDEKMAGEKQLSKNYPPTIIQQQKQDSSYVNSGNNKQSNNQGL